MYYPVINDIDFNDLEAKTSANFVKEVKKSLSFSEDEIESIKNYIPVIHIEDGRYCIEIVIKLFGNVHHHIFYKTSKSEAHSSIGIYLLSAVGFVEED